LSVSSRLQPRMFLGASLLAGAILASARPAAVTLDPTGPDLSLSLAESASQVASGGPLTYSLTIRNTPVYDVFCDLDQHGKPLCYKEEVAGCPVGSVVVPDSLPTGSSFVSASGDHGFGRFQFGGVVTCSNGALTDDDRATITITITAPSLPRGGPNTTLTNSAIVDAGHTINARDYANNSASASATDVAPK
jgi:hypothetical protein